MPKLNLKNPVDVMEEYNLGATKVKICNDGNVYINLSENEKKDRDYSIGTTFLRLLSEVEISKPNTLDLSNQTKNSNGLTVKLDG